MPSRKFIFPAQPALDKALHERTLAEQRVMEMKRQVKAERDELALRHEKEKKTVQQIATEHDNLTSLSGNVSPDDLLARFQSVEGFELRLVQERRAIVEQEERLRSAEEILADRERELREISSRVDALEKFKETRLKEHNAALLKAEDEQRDDETIQRWNSRDR